MPTNGETVARNLFRQIPLGIALLLAMVLFATTSTSRAEPEYQRQVDTAPNDASIGAGYVTPDVQRPLARGPSWYVIDTIVLVCVLLLAMWFVLVLRNRLLVFLLALACLAYFGFWRKGCVCPIGAIQNISVVLTDTAYAVPYVVIAFFVLPLVLALLFGRVFCGGVCPLGAIQEVVLLKPVQVPRRWDRILGSLKYVYLVAAIFFAVGIGVERDFIICRFDPFVGFFRMSGSGGMLITGGVFLLIGLFVGRPYCRYLCPYGAILALLSRISWRGVTITPDRELDCGLCVEACPYGAIENMRAVKSSCLYCARCFKSCPRERVDEMPNTQGKQTATPVATSHEGDAGR